MFPIFTISVCIFVIIFTIGRVRNTKAQEKVQEDFWTREQQANTVRKKDISQLDYITIPSWQFPLDLHTPAEQAIQELSDKKILNLTGYTNTDLKLMYGTANLSILTEYDENFTQLVRALCDYAHELLDADRTTDATCVLEFGASIHADASFIYTGLAEIYQSQQNFSGIEHLIQTAEQLPSITKDTLISKLKNYLPNVE